jgi:large subunit ribosomal protein L21
MYAIVNISGKQFKATEGLKVRVPKQIGEEGSALEFDNVLLVNDGTNTHVGDPTVSGASVTATILNHGRDKKILVYKKKRRKGYQRKNGHRQWYTELQFQKIISSNTKKAKTASKNTEPVVEKSAQEEE